MDVLMKFTLFVALLWICLDSSMGYTTNGRTMYCTDDDLESIMYLDFDGIDVLKFDTSMKNYVMESLKDRKVDLIVVFDDGDVREVRTWGNEEDENESVILTTLNLDMTTSGNEIDSQSPPTRLDPSDDAMSTVSTPSSSRSLSTRTLAVVLSCAGLGMAVLCTVIICLVLWRRRRGMRAGGPGIQMANPGYDGNVALDEEELLNAADGNGVDPVIVNQPQGGAAGGDDGPVAGRTRSKGPGLRNRARRAAAVTANERMSRK